MMRQMVPGDDELGEVMVLMIEHAQARGTHEALAMATVLSTMGPQQVRLAASAARIGWLRPGSQCQAGRLGWDGRRSAGRSDTKIHTAASSR